MGINSQEMSKALQTGLKMLTSENVTTPNSWNQDLAYLQNVFVSLLTGTMDIIPAETGIQMTDKKLS